MDQSTESSVITGHFAVDIDDIGTIVKGVASFINCALNMVDRKSFSKNIFFSDENYIGIK